MPMTPTRLSHWGRRLPAPHGYDFGPQVTKEERASRTRRGRIVKLGLALLAGMTLIPMLVSGQPSSTVAGAADSLTVSPPGSYALTISEVDPVPKTFAGTLTIVSSGIFSFTLAESGAVYEGIWTQTGSSLAMDVAGETGPLSISSSAFVLAGHLYSKGIKDGTFELWKVDGSGNPTSFEASGTWSALPS